MTTHYDIIDTAALLLSHLSKADDETLDKAYQVIANRANDSEYASSAEPYSGLAVAIQAEFSRRALHAKWEAADEEEQPEPAEPFTNDDRCFGPEEA